MIARILTIFSTRSNRLPPAAYLCLYCLTSAVHGQQPPAESATPKTESMLLVVGAPGEQTYEAEFGDWANQWEILCKRQQWTLQSIAPEEETPSGVSQKQRLQSAIQSHVGNSQRLWIVLLGHGTFARNIAKFNLAGEDVSAAELAGWLKPVTTPLVIVNCSSSSGPFMTALAGPNRTVVTATRAGSELNYSRFGKFLSAAISDERADIDHDEEVSLLESFLMASAKTEQFYKDDARLTTEHALLDDNGDGAGTSSDFYQGTRPSKTAKSGKSIDGTSAGKIILFSSPNVAIFSPDQQLRRDAVEQRIEKLRLVKAELSEEVYLDQLEVLVLELAAIYDEAETAQQQSQQLDAPSDGSE